MTTKNISLCNNSNLIAIERLNALCFFLRREIDASLTRSTRHDTTKTVDTFVFMIRTYSSPETFQSRTRIDETHALLMPVVTEP